MVATWTVSRTSSSADLFLLGWTRRLQHAGQFHRHLLHQDPATGSIPLRLAVGLGTLSDSLKAADADPR